MSKVEKIEWIEARIQTLRFQEFIHTPTETLTLFLNSELQRMKLQSNNRSLLIYDISQHVESTIEKLASTVRDHCNQNHHLILSSL